MEVQLVALQADKGFVLLQEVIGYGTVGCVTYGTVLQHGGMFKDKGPLF
jgi:hypothetical protein